jgi:hypothetical protein
MKQLWEALDFCRNVRRKLRFGEISRSPLRLLRMELQGETVECEWIARSADVWDTHLRPSVRHRNASLQALQDAMAIRDLLFSELPAVQTATLRAYRQMEGQIPELIIAGTVARGDVAPRAIRSVAMRAKLQGLRFWLDDGILETLQQEERGGRSRREPAFV